MLSIFCNNPWVMPPEPAIIRRIFEERGALMTFAKSTTLAHGGSDGLVYCMKKGVVTFGYLDAKEDYQVLSLIIAGRTVGDLDSLDPAPCGIIAEVLKPSELWVLHRDEWLAAIRTSVETMEAYALSANRKHQCAMEGMIANYTQPLELRLKYLILALIQSHYPVRPGDWNPCPVTLNITDIAHIVASSRSWVSRTISGWIEAGLVRKDRRILLFHGRLFQDELTCGKYSTWPPASA